MSRKLLTIVGFIIAAIVLLPFSKVLAATFSPTSVSITSPTTGSQVSGQVPLIASASGSVTASGSAQIITVNFFADGGFVGSSNTSPYQTFWDTQGLVPGSSHILQARAYDTQSGSAISAPVTVQITPDTTAPSVQITSPANGSSVRRNTQVNFTARAQDNYQMAKVEFYINNTLLCSDVTAPYSCTWLVPNRRKVSYTLTAKAYDVFGNNSTTSISVISY